MLLNKYSSKAIKFKGDFFNYWSSALKRSTSLNAKETESNLVECSESNAPSNLEPIEVDLVAEEAQMTTSRAEDSNFQSVQQEKK